MILDKEKIYYVYAYLDPRYALNKKHCGVLFKNVPFYIGKGKFDRCDEHMKEYFDIDFSTLSSEQRKNLHRKLHKIKNIFKNKHCPIVIKLREGMGEEKAYSFEKKLIKSIGRIEDGGTLTNYREGGYVGNKLGKDSKVKISKSLKDYYKNNDVWNKGVPMSDEEKENLRHKNLGKKQSENSISKRVESLKKVWLERGDDIIKKKNETLKKRGYVRDNVAIGKKISKTKRGNVKISESQKKQIAETLRNRPKLTCPHCGKEGNGSNMTHYHFDNCLENTNIDKGNIIKCPHCSKRSLSRGSMNRWHFDNCKYNPDISKESLNNRCVSEESKRKMSLARKRKINENSTSGKCVVKINISDGRILSEFKSIKMAANSVGKERDRSISKCCLGENKTAYGYLWIYKSDYIQNPSIIVEKLNLINR